MKNNSTPAPVYRLSPGLTCQRCGRHDASIRLVSYPFAYGMGYVLRGEFKGRWCHRHRILYLLLAALITCTLGMLGIQSIYLVPLTLLQLARGGSLHKANNTKQLRTLAEAKQQQGDGRGARECIEASFQFTDDLWGQEQLAQQYVTRLHEDSSPSSPFLSHLRMFAGFMACSVGLGVALGLASYLFDDVLLTQVAWRFAALQPLLSWLPLLGLGIPAVLLLGQLQERLLERTHLRQTALVVGLALFAAFLMNASILGGRALANFVEVVAQAAFLPPAKEILATLGAILGRSAALENYRLFSAASVGRTFRWVYLTILLAYSLYALRAVALSYLTWQKRLAKVQSHSSYRYPSSPLAGWAPMLAWGMGCIALVLAFPQKSVVDFLEARDHFSAGWDLQVKGEYEKAIAEFRQAVRLDASMVEGYEELGWTLDESGDSQEAIRQLLTAVELGPRRVNAHFYLAGTYYFDGQSDKAAQEFENVLRLDAAYTQAYLGLGWSAYSLGDLDKAETNFKRALELDPSLYDAYVGLGSVYEERGDVDRQIEFYLKATRSGDSSSESYLFLGTAYMEKFEYDLAIESLEKAVLDEDGYSIARIYLGLSYLQAGKIDQAVALTQKTVEMDAEWAAPHALLASAYLDMNQMDKAGEELEIARSLEDKMDFDRFLILNALLQAERFTDAEEDARDGLRNGYSQADFSLDLARALSGQERYVEAFQACEQAEEAGAEAVDGLTCRGELYLDQEDFESGLELLLQAQELAPQDPFVHNLLSVAYYGLEKFSLSVGEAQEAVRVDRYLLNGFMNLAYASVSSGDYGQAIRAATRATELSPYYDIPYYVLGISYLNTYEERAAYTAFHKFLELYREDADSSALRREVEKTLQELEKRIDETG